MPVLQIPGHEHPRPREVMLEEIQNLMGNCQRCELGQTRTNIVFGTGNPHARVMFVGEGPGRNEDLKGEPFVGAAGHKLDSLLSLAGLTRDEIYIANVVKCRPPSNRNPKPAEIEACSPFLREQIRSIWPDVIVCLGNFASQWVLKTDRGIMTLRGKLYQTGHFVVAPTFHPAACIYHSDWQPLLEEDLRRVGAWLDEHPVATAGVVSAEEAALEAVHEGGRIPLYHFDLYRLHDSEELGDAGVWDVLGGDGACVFEWGEQFADELGDERVDVFVTRLEGESAEVGGEPRRHIELVSHDARGDEFVAAVRALL